jgi:hypothetical protein
MSTGPTKQQIKAVRAVLYKRSRLRQIYGNYRSIDVLLQIAPTSVNDGPNWVIQHTGEVDPSVLDAAQRARQIASAMQSMASELGSVSLPGDDRQNLVAALNAQAAAWTARAGAWSVPNANGASAAVATIAAHEGAARDAASKVREYLQTNDELNAGSL